MKRLSLWARVHIIAARIIIILSFILLTILGIVTGSLLTDIGVTISLAAMWTFIVTYFAALVAYPSKSLKGNKLNNTSFYVSQKSCDLLLSASTFCMIVYLSNQPNKLFNYSTTLHAAVPAATSFPKDSTLKNYKTIAAFSASFKDETGKSLKWKEKKKLLKEQVRAIKKTWEMSEGVKVALIILSVAVALGLLYALAALACDISCSGSEGGAILVAIGGTALVVFLLMLAIRAITGKKKNPKKMEGKPDDSGGSKNK